MGRRTKQFIHDITPLDSKGLRTRNKENQRKLWNWFHTLTERKPPVKSEFMKPIGWSSFPTSCHGCMDSTNLQRISSSFCCARLAPGKGRRVSHQAGPDAKATDGLIAMEAVPKKTTIREVAQAAAVGIGTISRVLNSSSQVSRETRARVLEAIRRLGFAPMRRPAGFSSDARKWSAFS